MKDKELLKLIHKHTHLLDIDGNESDTFCFAADILAEEELEMTEEELAKVALKNGYSVFKAFADETMMGGIVIGYDGMTKDPIVTMYEDFYDMSPEISELTLNDEGELVEKSEEEPEEVKEEIELTDEVPNMEPIPALTDRDRFGDITKYENKLKRQAARYGATIDFHTKVGPKRLDSMWYPGQKIATITIHREKNNRDYIIELYADNFEPYIKLENGEVYRGINELEDSGIYNDEHLTYLEDYEIPGIEFKIRRAPRGRWYYGYDDLEVDTFWSIPEAFDFSIFVNDIIPELEGEVVDEAIISEKKKKKAKVNKVGDPNAKAMWGRTRSQTFKPKKGKGSFRRNKRVSEAYEAPKAEELEEFKKVLDDNGYNIESESFYNGLHFEGAEEYPCIHYQIISKESNYSPDTYGEHFDMMADIIDDFWESKGFRPTYNFGLTHDGTSTAGLDIRPKHIKDVMVDLTADDIATESVKLNEEEVSANETMKEFADRVSKMIGKKVKIIEAYTRITEAKADIDKFIAWGGQDLYDRFLKQKQRLQGQEKDILYWTSTKNPHKPEELEAKLSELENKKTKSELDAEAKAGAEKVAENDKWEVYKINTFAASQKYGKNAQWCISGSKRWVRGDSQPSQYWDNYTRNGTKFYFFLRKDGQGKYAFAMSPNGSRQVYNATDDYMNKSQVNKELADAPYVEGVFIPPSYHKKSNLPHLQNARNLHYVFNSEDDYVHHDDVAVEFRRKTKGLAVFPEQFHVIEDLCFAGKPELTEVYIHKNVNYVGVYAFLGCSGLSIKCEAASKPEDWEDEWNPDNRPVEWGVSLSDEEEPDIEDVQTFDHI